MPRTYKPQTCSHNVYYVDTQPNASDLLTTNFQAMYYVDTNLKDSHL
jgi:hypothetical protein